MDYIIYSHTDYLDVLKINLEFSSNLKNKILFINSTDLYHYSEHFKRVIYYNDDLNYSQKLYICLSQIDSEYFLMMHDTDIITKIDEDVLDLFAIEMKNSNIDRIDLQYLDKTSENIKIQNSNIELTLNQDPKIEGSNITNYVFNVNPSIWKKSTFMNLLANFPNETYRTIENIDVQKYCCSNIKNYRLYSENTLSSTQFKVLDCFAWLHITHSRKWCGGVNCCDRSNPVNEIFNIQKVHEYIIENNKKTSKRGFH